MPGPQQDQPRDEDGRFASMGARVAMGLAAVVGLGLAARHGLHWAQARPLAANLASALKGTKAPSVKVPGLGDVNFHTKRMMWVKHIKARRAEKNGLSPKQIHKLIQRFPSGLRHGKVVQRSRFHKTGQRVVVRHKGHQFVMTREQGGPWFPTTAFKEDAAFRAELAANRKLKAVKMKGASMQKAYPLLAKHAGAKLPPEPVEPDSNGTSTAHAVAGAAVGTVAGIATAKTAVRRGLVSARPPAAPAASAATAIRRGPVRVSPTRAGVGSLAGEAEKATTAVRRQLIRASPARPGVRLPKGKLLSARPMPSHYPDAIGSKLFAPKPAAIPSPVAPGPRFSDPAAAVPHAFGAADRAPLVARPVARAPLVARTLESANESVAGSIERLASRFLRKGAHAFDESKHPRGNGGRFAAIEGNAGSSTAAKSFGVDDGVEAQRQVRVKAIGAYMKAIRGQRLVYHGSQSAIPELKALHTGAAYVTPRKALAQQLAGRQFTAVVNRYVVPDHMRIVPLRSQAAARIFLARDKNKQDSALSDYDLAPLAAKFGMPLRALENDYFRENVGIKPKLKRTPLQQAIMGSSLRDGGTHPGVASFYWIDPKQRAYAAKLGVHGVEAPEYKSGDSFAVFNPEMLQFVGANRPKAARWLRKGAHAFDESKHPRDARGEFASTGTSPVPRRVDGTLVTPQRAAAATDHPRRTQARMSSVNRTGSRIHALPIEYTGSTERELPVSSFLHGTALKTHKPKSLTLAQHQAILGGLTQVIHGERENTIAAGYVPKRKGKLAGTTLIPDGTERRTVVRAYHHGAMLALHDYGVGTYNFHMDDALKAEMTPLIPFIRYSRRRVVSVMRGAQKGLWRPYRAEFGQPFADHRRDKVTGAVRLRVPPNDVLVKFDEEEDRDKNGRWTGRHPYLTGVGATIAAAPAVGAAQDVVAGIRGKPFKAIQPKASGFAALAGLDAQQAATMTRATKWREGEAAIGATGGMGHGTPLTQLLAGGGGAGHADDLISGLDQLASDRAGFGSSKTPDKLWRGSHGKGARAWLKAKPGSTITIDPHSSWTRDSSVASHFTAHSFTRKAAKDVATDLPDDMGATRAGKTLSNMYGSNVTENVPKARVVLRDARSLRNLSDIEQASGMAGVQSEVMLGRGTKVRIDKIRDSKAGRVIFATALKQNPTAAYRRGIVRRLASPAFHGGRAVSGLALGLGFTGPLAWATHGWLWGQKAPEKPGA